MKLFHEILFLETVKSKVIISLFETMKLLVSISPRNLYNSLKSIKEKCVFVEKLENKSIANDYPATANQYQSSIFADLFVLHMYVAMGQGEITPLGQNFDNL